MDAPDTVMVEGFAHVVAVDGAVAWLEPEATTSCSGCAASLACETPGIGTLASRVRARRFPLANHENFVVGERIVVGVRENTLVSASLTVYALPMVTMLGAGITAQWAVGRDGITLVASLVGLLLGFGIAHLRARHLIAKGSMDLSFIRRADGACHSQ
ncbi:sigma-E factor negative regulatory protein RseC [Gammaproteobacteria bacterium]